MEDTRSLILEHILPLVPFDGWSEHTLAQAAKRSGIGTQDLKLAFPAGPADCIDYFFTREDEALSTAYTASALSQLRMPERIEALILARLERFVAHKEAVRRAVAARALPWNALRGIQSLYRTVDMIWKLAGDKATDFSFYTKRATLAGLYSSTLLYWLNDESQDMAHTEAFLKRRLADIAAFGKKKKAFSDKFRTA